MRRIGRVVALSMVLTVLPLYTAAGAEPTERVIVVLDATGPASAAAASDAAEATGGRILYVYEHAISGFVIEVASAAVDALSRRPGVAWVEPDRVVSITQTGSQPVPTHIDRAEADLNPPTSPVPVDIAIIDTGVWIGHSDLNLQFATDCTGAIFYPTFGGCVANGDLQDGNGHGTHVAGLAAACDNDIGTIGTAPCAVLTSVKVLGADGSGFLGSILAGVDLVAANASWLDVANASWGFEGTSAALDASIDGVINAGVVFVAAAGNNSQDISTFSPASHPDVITVTALADFDGLPGGLGAQTCRTDVDDTLADFSNFGPGADIAAPGVCLYSSWLNNTYNTISGTSMASPVVAGAVGRYIAENGKPTNRVQVLAVRDAIVNGGFSQTGSCGFTDDADTIPEPVLSLNGSAFGGPGTCESGPVVNQPPTAAFTYDCPDLTCTFDSSASSDDTGITSYSWSFGDGSGSLEASPIHMFPAAGTYQVDLTVSDVEALTDTTSQMVTVSIPPPNDPPTAAFTSSCPDLRCSFDATTSTDGDGQVVSYSWDFGDGTIGTGINPSHGYAGSGTYQVSLIVTDDDGADSVTFEQDVTVVNATPVASFVGSCSGLTCTADASGSADDGGIVSYEWTFGDGGTATGPTTSHTYAVAGNYLISLTVTDAELLSSTAYTTVTVEEAGPLTMTTGNLGFMWDANAREATILLAVIDENLDAVEGATLSGTWTALDNRGRERTKTASGVSDQFGLVTIVTKFPPNQIPNEFCVTDIVADGYIYTAGIPCGGMVTGSAEIMSKLE